MRLNCSCTGPYALPLTGRRTRCQPYPADIHTCHQSDDRYGMRRASLSGLFHRGGTHPCRCVGRDAASLRIYFGCYSRPDLSCPAALTALSSDRPAGCRRPPAWTPQAGKTWSLQRRYLKRSKRRNSPSSCSTRRRVLTLRTSLLTQYVFASTFGM